MKRIVIISLCALCLLSSCKERPFQGALYYENGIFSFQLDKSDYLVYDFKLINKTTKEIIQGEANLLVIDGIVPECGLVEDYNNPSDVTIYQCDSTYTFENPFLYLSFAMEIRNRKRMDLEIWQSAITGFPVGGYTLQQNNTVDIIK